MACSCSQDSSSAFTDNAAVNFEKNVSVYQKLKERYAGIVKANCKCHILHNRIKYALKALTFDIEPVVLKTVFSKVLKELQN